MAIIYCLHEAQLSGGSTVGSSVVWSSTVGAQLSGLNCRDSTVGTQLSGAQLSVYLQSRMLAVYGRRETVLLSLGTSNMNSVVFVFQTDCQRNCSN